MIEHRRTPRTRRLRSRLTIALVVGVLSTVVAAGALAQVGKSGLIGKLEGPEVVTDPAKQPKTFKEAPQLAELVKAGKLPPVAERIGQDPLVIKPLQSIGKYGGTWRAGFTGPADYWNGFRCCSGPDHLMFWDYTGDKALPNLAKGLEMQDGGRAWLVHLRRGMKWSDGKPFTADDFVFWFEDIYKNKDLIPTPSAAMAINGKQGTIEKVDTLTVRFKFPEPYFMLPDMLAGSTDLAGQWNGYKAMGGFAPAHYLKQFHPKYAGEAELDKKVKEAKFDSWVRMFLAKNDWALNPDLPVLSPWKTVTPNNTPTWTLERNPYSVFVDTAGNQLPYIDKVVMTLAENLEVLNLRAIAGEYDYASRHVDLGKLPVFLENQKKGNYKVYLDPGDYCDLIIKFNLNYDADPEIAKWFNTADFRRALSLGIDRDQINETFWLGTGTPGSVVPVDSNKYNPGPQYRKLWATLDPKKANEMLDKIGLAKKDAEGYRLRADGKGRLRIEIMTLGGQFVQYTQISEMIREQWKKIGIDLQVKEVERSLALQRTAANEQQLAAWNNDGSEHLFTFPQHVFPFELAAVATSGPLYVKWFHSAGAQGKEPEPRMKELMEKWKKAFGVPEKERIQLGKDVWRIAAEEVYIIGVVGQGPAAMGVRVVKNNMGNIPSRMYNSPDGKTPGISRPATFYYK
ncbi:MAG TPA: ABC transporter substrate-binding protein [Methylomirabilota bacterium]|nr:ABC transporter substrate-binding protein [Methylomirabilota bacterium]